MPGSNRLSVEFIGRFRLVPGATDPRAGRFRAHHHRPWPDADRPDQPPGHQCLGQSGTRHEARPVHGRAVTFNSL